MDERYDCNKMDEIMLPGFRFHPTDEELVGFYLKRKIQHQPLSIELIKQLDIYKYDPWDLPKVATTGEKEWYFYCPRDRKYRNSARPNRVTGAGFWKATGTDRPIYSSEGNKCIGLKKSLVFYTGRAAKGIKTDWMMHEFRLPTLTNSTTPKRFGERNLPAEDSWAICRIFKKTSTMAQRALSHSWVSPLPETTGTQILDHGINSTRFASENTSCLSEGGSAIQFYSDNDTQQSSSTSFPPLPVNPTISKQCLLPTLNGDLLDSFISSFDMSGHGTCTVDVASMLLNFPPALLGENEKGMNDINFSGTEQAYEGFTITSPQGMQGHTDFGEEETWLKHNLNCLNTFQVNDQLGSVRPLEFHSVLPPSLPDTWRSNLPWDSLPFPCEISASYSANKCYT